jgi:hypothetical protein
MKKIIWIALFLLPVFSFAQDDEDQGEKFFRKEKCFTGGGLNLSFGSDVTVLGVNPHFGYTFFNFLEAAVAVNFNYSSLRDPYSPDKDRQTVTSPGVFIRLFPVKFLFAQVQYEHSFIRTKYFRQYVDTLVEHQNANSILVGGGFASGREPGEFYYYFSVLWDLAEDINSPYSDYYGRAIPIIRAGVNIPLFQGKGRKRD